MTYSESYVKALEEQIVALKNLNAAKSSIMELVVEEAKERETEYKQEILRLRTMLEKKGVYFLDPNAEFEG